MKYEIRGGNLPVVLVDINAGESLFTQSGGMAWMTNNISMSTNMEGGLFGGLARAFSGESLFMATYTCQNGTGTIAFASTFPGTILPIQFDGTKTLICQKDAFLAAERSVNLEVIFRRKLGAGLFGGEGFIMQKISGNGTAFLELDGDIVEYTLQPGQVLKVDTGHVAAFDSTVAFEVETVKGFKNILFGGEGLFLTKLTGPGKVWLQTMPIQNVAKRILPFLPHDTK